MAGSPCVLALAPRLTHRRMRRRIGAWLDGEVTVAEARAVRRHLDECWGCSGEAELLRLAKAALARLADREPTALAASRLRRWADRLDASPPV